MDQTKSHIELVTNPELDDQSLLPEPNTEALNSHLHEESLKPITPSILLAPHMLKYHEKIIDRLCLAKIFIHLFRVICKVQKFSAEDCILLNSFNSYSKSIFCTSNRVTTLSKSTTTCCHYCGDVTQRILDYRFVQFCICFVRWKDLPFLRWLISFTRICMIFSHPAEYFQAIQKIDEDNGIPRFGQDLIRTLVKISFDSVRILILFYFICTLWT